MAQRNHQSHTDVNAQGVLLMSTLTGAITLRLKDTILMEGMCICAVLAILTTRWIIVITYVSVRLVDTIDIKL